MRILQLKKKGSKVLEELFWLLTVLILKFNHIIISIGFQYCVSIIFASSSYWKDIKILWVALYVEQEQELPIILRDLFIFFVLNKEVYCLSR